MAPVGEAAKVAAKIMFEVYREGGYDRRYRVVYFTELNDHNRDTELNRCIAGTSFYSSFLKEETRKEARIVINKVLERLNDGEDISPAQLEAELGSLLA
ncbi:MAG: hypothetical protein QOD86_802 [Miltoncostaeaceae bacterium]|nr:hypothetical protein [Miltoncostaeaceae bacterium]